MEDRGSKKVEPVPREINQMMDLEQLRHYLRTSKDRFFMSLEKNLNHYINDRSAAYDYITRELNQYDGKFPNLLFLIKIFLV